MLFLHSAHTHTHTHRVDRILGQKVTQHIVRNIHCMQCEDKMQMEVCRAERERERER